MMDYTDLSEMASCCEISPLCVDKFKPPHTNISASHILLVSYSECSSNRHHNNLDQGAYWRHVM